MDLNTALPPRFRVLLESSSEKSVRASSSTFKASSLSPHYRRSYACCSQSNNAPSSTAIRHIVSSRTTVNNLVLVQIASKKEFYPSANGKECKRARSSGRSEFVSSASLDTSQDLCFILYTGRRKVRRVEEAHDNGGMV